MVTVVIYDAQAICQAACVSESCLIEIVEHGIVEPKGECLSDWMFDLQAISLVRKAIRIQRDFELDWSATALAIDLLEKIEQLNAENEYLRQHLGRLETDDSNHILL